jgi:hypothetical protein
MITIANSVAILSSIVEWTLDDVAGGSALMREVLPLASLF